MILLFPPQSPDFPVIAERFQDHAPAPVMSCKSTFEAVTVPAVIVYAVHLVDDCTSNLLVAELPASVRVQETV